MIRAQVDLVGQPEFRRRNPPLIGPNRLFEDLIAARILHLKGQVARGSGLMIGTVQSQRSNMNGLARLINRFLRGQ